MKLFYCLIFAVGFLVSCTSEPKFKISDCVASSSEITKKRDSWESKEYTIYKILQIGDYTYKVLVAYELIGWKVYESSIRLEHEDFYSKVDCPKRLLEYKEK